MTHSYTCTKSLSFGVSAIRSSFLGLRFDHTGSKALRCDLYEPHQPKQRDSSLPNRFFDMHNMEHPQKLMMQTEGAYLSNLHFM